jgi:hypothetical protein
VPDRSETTGAPLGEGIEAIAPGEGEPLLTRALRHHALWLALTWLGLILLMARAYA